MSFWFSQIVYNNISQTEQADAAASWVRKGRTAENCNLLTYTVNFRQNNDGVANFQKVLRTSTLARIS